MFWRRRMRMVKVCREAFGVRQLAKLAGALDGRLARKRQQAGALQTLRAVRLRLARALPYRRFATCRPSERRLILQGMCLLDIGSVRRLKICDTAGSKPALRRKPLLGLTVRPPQSMDPLLAC